MGLGVHSIRTWEEMKATFLEKYKDCCMPHNLKDEVFKMMQKEDENLEDFIEIFSYNVKRDKMHNLDEETLKYLLLKYIRDEWINLLNLMGKGYISQLSFGDICELFIHISIGKARSGKIQEILLCLRLINLQLGQYVGLEYAIFLTNLKQIFWES